MYRTIYKQDMDFHFKNSEARTLWRQTSDSQPTGNTKCHFDNSLDFYSFVANSINFLCPK